MIRHRHRKVSGSLSALGLIALVTGCTPSKPVPEVEYSNCWAVYEPDFVCSLSPKRQLRIWVETPPGTEVEIQAGGEDLPGQGEESKGGRRYRLTIPPRASSLTVRLKRGDGSRSAHWALRLAEPEKLPWQDKIENPTLSRPEIRQLLLKLRQTAPPEEQGFILGSLAELARQEGRYGDAIALLQKGIQADRAVRRLSEVAQKSSALLWIYLQQSRFAEARQLLSDLRIPPGAPAEAKYWVSHYKGALANRTGDYRTALEHLRQAADLAERVGKKKLRSDTEQVLADVLQQLGRSGEAAKLFEELLKTPPPGVCERGDLLTNWAWTRLLAREAGEEAEDPTPRLQEARTLFETGCQKQRLNARLNLAIAYFQAKRWGDARAMLAEAETLRNQGVQPTLPEILWWNDIAARLEIEEGRPQRALILYDELTRRAERARSLEGRVRASLGRSRALLELSRRDEALAALGTVDLLIDDQLSRIPMQEGRDTFLQQQEAAIRLHVEVLLEEGRPRDAFTLVRRSRSRLLRQLAVGERLSRLGSREQQRWDQHLSDYQQERDAIDQAAAQDWSLAGKDEDRERSARETRLGQIEADLDKILASLGATREAGLPPPLPDVVILTYYPLSSGWIGFAAYGSDVEVSLPFELPRSFDDPAALSSILLAPFHSVIERAKRVRVLPYGQLREVDFHALPWSGKPLLAGRPVVYGLDVPVSPSSATPPGRRTALLVADPQGNLELARDEARMIAAAIEAWGRDWTLETLETTEALAGEVRQRLPGAELFHFAGHGTFGGFGAWDSQLELADETSLTLGDLLVLRRMPAWVVLSSCEVGRSSQEAPGEGLGLAHAFVLAGARGVVAATRPVRDQTGHALTRALYRGWRPGKDLVGEFQRAQLECLADHPDCVSFRLIEP